MKVGNYEILETIGTGSFGKVKCKQASLILYSRRTCSDWAKGCSEISK